LLLAIATSDGETYSYKIKETKTVTPNAVEFVLPKDTETMTLYTCTGFLDSKRFMVIAEPFVKNL